MDPNTEIRKLRPAELYTLARILAASDSWKTLMATVPKEGTENEPKFNTEHFALIERASCQQRKSGAEIFLEEWSTMGKQRPTLKSTLDLLVKVHLFRAADYIAVDLLQREPPERPTCGPAAPIDISDEEIAKLMQHTASEFKIPHSELFDSKESLDSVLEGLGYPSQLSVTFSVESSVQHHEQEAQTQPVEFIGEISNLRIHAAEIDQNNSNLMQFSKSDTESCHNNHKNSNHRNNSNLIQFSSNSIRSTSMMDLNERISLENGVCNPHLESMAQDILQKQNRTYTSSSNNMDEFASRQIIKGENIPVQENCARVLNNSDADEFSNSDNCNDFELQSSELPAFVADIGRGSKPTYSEVRSSELPQFVVEIAHQRSNQSDTAESTESFGEPIISNDSTSSGISSNYLTNVTSPSDNNTESIIPICVNFRSGSLENSELVSAELPQFVADLGHRLHSENSTHTVGGDSELADVSSNEQYTGRLSDSRTVSTIQHLGLNGLNSEELPLVVSECNKMRSQLQENPRELVSAELPQCVAELQNVNKK